MFGYIAISGEGLSKERQERYRAYYCGLCRALMVRYGRFSRVMLSNDMTFLFILLSSLYEPEERTEMRRCLPHPLRLQKHVINDFSNYCADMNIALAYHKCRDDWKDDRSLPGYIMSTLLRKAYTRVAERHPEKCGEIERCLQSISEVERGWLMTPDEPANLTARMLGVIFRYREDEWACGLQAMGEALGRFVYLMDAYDDWPSDKRRGRYNPLAEYAQQEDYEGLCKESLSFLIAECAQIFEMLPLLLDVDILRNILYSGVWTRYYAVQRMRRGSLVKGRAEDE